MPENVRSPLRPAQWRSLISRAIVPLLAVTVASASACTESFEGGAACPSLCPGRVDEFRDTIVDAIAIDTSLGNFPTLGLSSFLLLANRGDTVQTSAVIRYDILPRTFRPNGTGDTVPITVIDSAWIRLAIDTTGSLGADPVLIEAFDVDTAESDSVTAVVQSLFRPDRLLGSVTVVPASLGDSLRIRLDKDKVLSGIVNSTGLRVGLRISGNGQIRFLAFALGSAAPILSFDPTADTIYSPLLTLPSTTIANGTGELTLSYSVYTIVDKGTAPAGEGFLQLGGYPAHRAYFRFEVPPGLIDSTTIVRAELLLSQVESPLARPTDSVFVDVLVPTTSDALTDVRRILDLAAVGASVGLDTTRFQPFQSGERAINVLGLVRTWRFLPANVPRAIGLRMLGEGATALDVRFYSTEGAPSVAQRPRLRLTYLPRAEFALP